MRHHAGDVTYGQLRPPALADLLLIWLRRAVHWRRGAPERSPQREFLFRARGRHLQVTAPTQWRWYFRCDGRRLETTVPARPRNGELCKGSRSWDPRHTDGNHSSRQSPTRVLLVLLRRVSADSGTRASRDPGHPEVRGVSTASRDDREHVEELSTSTTRGKENSARTRRRDRAG